MFEIYVTSENKIHIVINDITIMIYEREAIALRAALFDAVGEIRINKRKGTEIKKEVEILP